MSPFYRFSWRFMRGVFRVGFDWNVYHPERAPLSGPVILASNHASFLDPPLVGCGVDRAINFLARDTLFAVPVVGAAIRALNSVPVDRDGGGGAGLKSILDRLEKGGGILLFPEGTRTADGEPQPARAGIGLTVIKSTAPVIPVRVFGTYEVWGRRRRWPKLGKLAVKYGHPLDFAELRTEARRCSKSRLKGIYLQVAKQIMAEISKLEPCADISHFGRCDERPVKNG
jgi:1-acyl-sn-glycerol-3-phosphate acyltransferase